MALSRFLTLLDHVARGQVLGAVKVGIDGSEVVRLVNRNHGAGAVVADACGDAGEGFEVLLSHGFILAEWEGCVKHLWLFCLACRDGHRFGNASCHCKA